MMKKLSLLIVLGMCVVGNIRSWGFLSHRTINQNACLALPKPLFNFYKLHVNYLVAHATDADSRRNMVEGEACKHFIDCDYYEKAAPLDTICKDWRIAITKLPEDTILKHGIVPYQCTKMMYWLTKAFEEKNVEKILKLSADLGHYIADAHVPLHTTSNYNGQKTNQHGIHSLWETKIPEHHLSNYPIFISEVNFIRNYPDSIWKAVEESYGLVNKVLFDERMAKEQTPENLQYQFTQKGGRIIKQESAFFVKQYEEKVGLMVQNRMKSAIRMVASSWYTAWILAGEPDLSLKQTPINEIPVPTIETEESHHH
jgi:hypothetical protein